MTLDPDPNVLVASGNGRPYREPVSGTIIHVVRRQGAPLPYVQEAKPPR